MKSAKQIVNEATGEFRKRYGFKRYNNIEHVALVGASKHWLQNNSSTDEQGSIVLVLDSQVPAFEEVYLKRLGEPFNGEPWHITLSVWHANVIGMYEKGHPADYTNVKYAHFLERTVAHFEEVVRRASTLRGALELVCERRWVYRQAHVRDRVVQIAKDLLATLPADELDALPNVSSNLDK